MRSLGVASDEAAVITRFAGGHPLTLVLGALTARERPGQPVHHVTMDRLLDEFALAYLDDLDEVAQRLLEAAAVVRRVSRPLVAAMLPDIDPWKAMDTLRRLPIVDATTDGLRLHEALQQAIAARLRAAEPARHRELRQRAWAHLREELRTVPKAELWRHTADMIYLLENPEVREAHFPSGAHQFAIETATPADADPINRIIDRHEPPDGAALLRAWSSVCPYAFRVARDWRGQVAGFSIITTTGRTDPRRLAHDPVVAMWLAHLRDNPSRPARRRCSSAAGSPGRPATNHAKLRPACGSTSSAPTWRCAPASGATTGRPTTPRFTGRSWTSLAVGSSPRAWPRSAAASTTGCTSSSVRRRLTGGWPASPLGSWGSPRMTCSTCGNGRCWSTVAGLT